jgi:hypothetical protein
MRIDWQRTLVIARMLLAGCALALVACLVLAGVPHTVPLLLMAAVVAFAVGPLVAWVEARLGRRGPAAVVVSLGLAIVSARRGLSRIARTALVLPFLVAGPGPTPSGADEAACRFQLGFEVLASLIGPYVGACLEDEQPDPDGGETTQRTTAGLFTWRAADNQTAFTDGDWTWLNGPSGLTLRLYAPRSIAA